MKKVRLLWQWGSLFLWWWGWAGIGLAAEQTKFKLRL